MLKKKLVDWFRRHLLDLETHESRKHLYGGHGEMRPTKYGIVSMNANGEHCRAFKCCIHDYVCH